MVDELEKRTLSLTEEVTKSVRCWRGIILKFKWRMWSDEWEMENHLQK